MLHTRVGLMLVVMLLAFIPVFRAAKKLPPEYQLCKKNDPKMEECLLKAIIDALKRLANGIPSLNVPTLDPLHLPALEIGQGQGPISVTFKFSNIDVTGLSVPTIRTAKVFFSNDSMFFDGTVNAVFESDYDLEGRILLIPVTGKGRCKLTFTDLSAYLYPIGEKVEKNGLQYLIIQDFKLDIYDVKRLQVNFENLFNGDKTLGDNVNTLLNDNWQDLWTELRPTFEKTFGAIFKHFSKSIFDKVPVDEIFLP